MSALLKGSLIAVGALVALLLTSRVFIPWLVNQHNDGALIAAVVLPIAIFTGAILVAIKVFNEDDI